MKPWLAFGLALLRAGRGRALPLALLALAALALEHIDATPLTNLRQAQFDRYQRQMPRPRDAEPVIVVGIDNQSLAAYGQWPWSRDIMARLVDKIMAGQPLALGLDIVFAEPDRYSPEVLAERLPALPRQALSQLIDPDRQLAKALSGGPAVLAAVGVANRLPGARQPQKPLPTLADARLAEQSLPHYPAALLSRPQLEQAAAGEGLISASPERLRSTTERGVFRRAPSLAFVDRHPLLSLPLEMVRLALGEGGTVVPQIGPQGMERIRIGDYSLPTQPNGEILLHFGQANAHYYLSAADVLAGQHPPELFANRFVLIGFNSTGLQDRIVTPLGENLPGVDLHAQLIESLLTGSALQRPVWLPRLELAALLLAGLLLIAAVPVLRPSYAALSYGSLSALLVGGGYLAFWQGQWLFDGPSLALLLSPVFMALLSNTLIAADARRREAERQLQQSREAAARVDGELDAARRIQMGLLPDPARAFAGERRFEVAALLEPARAVGGDYYDCFMLDERRLCLVIGDVSGKGIPASLFMAISKTLTGTLARREADLALAMRAVETELNRENPEFLFVTAFIGVLDVDSGELEFVCAGHDAPLLLRAGLVAHLNTLPSSGPPLCAVGDYPFEAARQQLQPGDLLCLFTDGVTEASDGHRLFGSDRLSACLADQPAAASPAACLAALRDNVRAFEGGQPPADDLTLLIVRWCGRPASER